jgi:GT2 family glycosyltransferase
VSVIIPTRNEQEHIQATLDVAQAAEDVEIIVVDGGSSDRHGRVGPGLRRKRIRVLRRTKRTNERGRKTCFG